MCTNRRSLAPYGPHFGDSYRTKEEHDHEADNIRDLDPGRYSEQPHWHIILPEGTWRFAVLDQVDL